MVFIYIKHGRRVLLDLKGHYIYCNEPHICYFLFSFHVTSSNNITSVYSVEHIPGVKKQSQHVF